jgi:hypothetical protein
MSQLQRAGQSGALDVAANQAAAKEQIATLVDMLRQLGGNPSVVAGAGAAADPLNAPFTLYVNPYIGSDRFVGGAYNSHEAGATDEEIIAQKLKRIELQRLECGYTPSRPFKTINRAVIEAAIITSKNWYTYTDPRAHVDCVSIVLAPAVHILYNEPGSGSTGLSSWGTSKDPSIAELIAFNPASVGGVLLPRGCSLCGPDLRKTTIRPNWVPAIANEAADYSNRRAMLKVTGTGYFFGHTFMDKVGLKESHHLLDPYGPASKVELDAFYAKCLSAVGTGADLSAALTLTRPTEFEIVGPIDITQSPTSQWDTTASASPYIFNCSVRSDYGMGGAFWDGSKIGGLKSMVCANFTGVSLQKDMRCWQVYENNNWVSLANTPQDYQKYINASPDNVRMNPARLSRHITAINDAFIQEVSVFAIGHGIHHFTDRGGEITVTNSNSSFGGCAALSTGYKTTAFPQDRNWTVGRVRVPLNLGEKTGNIRRVFLGTISAISGSKITLATPLAVDESSATIPAILLRDGYSLASGTKVWVENPTGDDWRTDLTSSAWSSSAANDVNISAALTQSGTNDPVGTNPDTGESLAIGKRVYIRRLVDTRSPSERRLSLQLNNTASARLPERNFVLQTDPARVGGAISRVLAAGGSEVLVVSSTGAGPAPGSGVAKTSEVTIRRGSPSVNYANTTFYRAGTIVKFAGKHFQSLRDQTTAAASPSPLTWGETFVHMPSEYNAEDPLRNEAPILTIDTDTDPAADTQTCGINFTTIWTSAGSIRDQYRSATDYLGVHAFLVALGFTAAAAHTALLPQVAASRDRNPTSSAQFPTAPSGGAANGLGNWAVEFRRPSVLRLYGHAFEWAGYLNYSKSIPAAQKDLGPQNKFTYYFTNAEGGRVVPQGSNEDGFNVTPRGLEDIETGATLSVDAIGNSTLDDFQRTDFPNGLTASEITVDSLTINTSVQFPEVSAAKTDALGPVRLADAAALRSQAGLSGTNDTQRNANINQEPDAVTIKGLNYWKIENRLVTARTGVQFIYVDPVNGRNITDINTIFGAPPVTESGADNSGNRQAVALRSLAAAANYANQAFGPTTTVEFRCGPGVYLDTGVITFSTVARIRAWDYAANTYLNNDKAGGTKPFMGQSSDGKTWTQTTAYFLNATNHPVFLGRPVVGFVQSPSEALYETRPLTLRFEQRGNVTGIVWWGPMQAIASASVPDSFFPGPASTTTWRSAAQSDPDNALNIFIKAQIDARKVTDSSSRFDSLGLERFAMPSSCIEANDSLVLANVAFGAMISVDVRSPDKPGLIRAALDGSIVEMRGIWLIGNVNISSQLSSAYKLRGESTHQITGHSTFVISTNRSVNTGIGAISFKLGGSREVTGGAGTNDADYNFAWNNIHLVNNLLAYPSTANDTNPSTAGSPSGEWKNIGPAIESFISNCTSIKTEELFWHAGFLTVSVNPTLSQGVAGKFGNWNPFDNLSANNRAKGIESIQAGFNLLTLAKHFILRAAGTISEPANSGYPSNPGEVGANENFDALNMIVTPVAKGIDVNNVTIISQNAKI